MNLGQLRSEVQANIGNENTSIATRINTWLNWSVLQMARRYNWLDLVSLNTGSYSTAVGTATVSLATTVKKIYSVRYVDTTDTSKSRYLIYRPAVVADRLTPYPPGDSTGTPYYYWVIGRTMYLYPVPAEAKNLYITLHSWPTAMTTDTDSPSIGNVDDIIVAGAVSRAYKALPQLDGADLLPVWEREFASGMLEANLMDRKLPGWRPIMRMHNAYSPSASYDPIADPFNSTGSYA